MLKTVNYTTQTPYAKSVQQPQNQNFATSPRSASQPRKDVFVKTAQPSFKGRGALTVEEFLKPAVDIFVEPTMKVVRSLLNDRNSDPRGAYKTLMETPWGHRTSAFYELMAEAAKKHPDRSIQTNASQYRNQAQAQARLEQDQLSRFNTYQRNNEGTLAEGLRALKAGRRQEAYKTLSHRDLTPYNLSAICGLLERISTGLSDPLLREHWQGFGRNNQTQESQDVLKYAFNAHVKKLIQKNQR